MKVVTLMSFQSYEYRQDIFQLSSHRHPAGDGADDGRRVCTEVYQQERVSRLHRAAGHRGGSVSGGDGRAGGAGGYKAVGGLHIHV